MAKRMSGTDEAGLRSGGESVTPVIDDFVAVSFERYLELVDRVCIREHDRWVAEVARRLRAVQGAPVRGTAAQVQSGEWTEIESLSRLRSVVGGRFQNLRDRWVAAGFPLREHRGDKQGGYALHEAGWIELASWIARQGFETRLTPDKPGCIFELRPVRAGGERGE